MILIFLVSSCVNTKKVTYFNDLTSKEGVDVQTDPVIQRNDQLSILVTSLNAEATAVFNAPNVSVIASSSGNGTTSQTTGYLVDKNGNINFPLVGNLKAAGLTPQELSDSLTNILLEKKLLAEPIVTVRQMNYKVTVLGEVNRPQVIPVSTGKLSLLEAIGTAGDMTLYAKRDNVLLIRTENGKKTTTRIDLNSPDFVFNSPYYYLKNNDVVYVEPNKAKVGSTTTARQILPIALSGLSLIVILVDRLTR